jgi:iron complex outermembrane receptor protein
VAASYADARYRATTLLGQPIESSDSKTPYFDANGRTLPNSPKWTGNIAVEYRYPVLTLTNLREFHSTLNYVYTSSYNADPSLSSYYVVPSYGLMDLSIGLGRSDGRFEVSLIAKNLFNTQYRYQGWTTWIPSAPRWEGLQLKYKML